jgi:hypothetical protein
VIIVDASKLKGKLVERGKNYSDCAKALSTTVTTFNKKMNGKSKFYIDEVKTLSNYLKLNNHEKIDIFLT